MHQAQVYPNEATMRGAYTRHIGRMLPVRVNPRWRQCKMHFIVITVNVK